MELITGRTGTPHVKAIDDAAIYKLFLGTGEYVLPRGNEFAASLNGSSSVSVSDGYLIMQGRLCTIRNGSETLSIDNGVSGYKRIDMVVAEYANTAGIESVTLKIVKGANGTTYVEPTLTTGNIDAGETHQMALWGIRIDGLGVAADPLVKKFTTLSNNQLQPMLDTVAAQMAQIEAQMTQLQTDIYAYAESLRAGITGAIAGYYKSSTVAAGTNVLTVTMPQAYSYAASDVIEVYLNGLKLKASEYSASGSGSALSIGLTNFTTTAVISELIEDNDIEVIAIKVGGEE